MRVSRATNGMYAMLIAITGATRPLPKSATAMIAISSDGKAKTTSKRRPSAASSQPPRQPASEPEQDAEDRRRDDHEQRAEQRRARAVDDAAQDVAAERVGAEPVRRRSGRRTTAAKSTASGSYGRDEGREHRGEREDRRATPTLDDEGASRGARAGRAAPRTARVGWRSSGTRSCRGCADRSTARARR